MGTVPGKNIVAGKVSKTKAPAQTLAEANYLKKLIDSRVPVRLHLVDNQEIEGTIEFFDARFVRLTRKQDPNVFVFKHDIKYIYELAQ
jgi:sRNA-binding regulator protein Hfq